MGTKRAPTKHRNAGVSVNYTTRDERAGTHNRKARRAGKLQQQGLFAPVDPEVERLRALWAAFGRHHEATRPQREARSLAFTSGQYDSENECLPPEHVNLTELIRRVGVQHERLRLVPFEDRQREALELVELIGGSPWLCDQSQIIDTRKGRIENERVSDGLAASLAIGALQPDGIKLWSMWFESVAGELKTRFLIDPENPWLEVSECA